MEESVWIYIGVIATVVTIGILVTIIARSGDDSARGQFFNGVEQLGAQARLVCAAPRDTMLSIRITVPSGARIFTSDGTVCGELGGDVRCSPADCALAQGIVLDLSSSDLFRERAYTCAVRNAELLEITCQG